MRINNRKSRKFLITVYFIFAVLFIFGSLSFSHVKGFITNARLKYAIMLGILVLVFIAFYKIAKYFEYDSDGNILVVINRNLLFSEIFNFNENRAEFPKTKLLYYKLNNYIFYISLNLYIRSLENRQKRLKFNVTFLSGKKRKYLKQSLDKVLRQNKENG